MNNSDIVLFETKDSSIVLPVRMTGDTVWLNRSQMAELFERDVKTIGKHINNALREEVDSSTVAKFATVQEEGNRSVTREIEYYKYWKYLSVFRRAGDLSDVRREGSQSALFCDKESQLF